MTKILVIEDESSIRHNIVDVLTMEGYEVVDASDGRMGVAVAQEERPDLIICDIMMPKLDGYGVLLALQDDPATARIPFIFLTAKASYHDLRVGMESGADDYLSKPLSIDQLLSAVQARLEKYARTTLAHQQELERLHEAIVTALPHELRTPLTGILGYSELLLDGLETMDYDAMRQMLAAINRAGNRLYRLVENYLLYAQLEMIEKDEAKKAALATIRTRNPAFAQSQVEAVAQQLATRYSRINDIAIRMPEAKLAISGDDYGKVVYELLDNAFKFSHPGDAIVVDGAIEDSTYHLQICDCGQGMSQHQVQQTGAFVQFDRHYYEQQGGGMGLAIAQRLIGLNGGRFDLVSSPDEGTTIELQISLA